MVGQKEDSAYGREDCPMLVVRQTFQAKYGRGDELVALFKEFHSSFDVPNRDSARILTDATGAFFTVVTEYHVESLGAWEEAFGRMMGSPGMEDWFGRMMPLVETGRRDFYHVVS